MTLLKQTYSRTAVAVMCGLVLSLTASMADESNKRTILTVSQTVQIGDATLQPGRYVIKLLDSQSERHVVQIFNATQTHIIDTVIAVPIQRVTPRGHTTFTYYETPAGSVQALRTWYYPGDSVGQQFLEPKHHEMLTAGTAVVSQPLAFDEETAASSATVTQASNDQPSAAPPAADQQSGEQQSADRQATEPAPAQTEVAQNTTPAPTNDTAAQSPAPADQPASQPATQLPQTGSSYPEIGLLGLMLLGLAGLSRVLRRA